MKKLEKVQRKAARYVLGKHKKTESVSEMLRVLRWESLQERRKRSRLCGMFRIMSGERAWKEFGKDIAKPSFVGKNDHQFKIKCRSQRTNAKQFSFLNRTIMDWNDLPAKLFEPFPKNLHIFKKLLKK